MADLSIYGSSSDQANPEKKKKKKKPDLPIVPIRNTADYQRMKLERLMANPEKPVVIPTRPKDKNISAPPEFVRNVMGSSAGAGSGEFHVYRHLRRKEYARQKAITEKGKVEDLDDEFQRKLEENKKLAELKTAKKRAKRLKKKQNSKIKKKKGSAEQGGSSGSSSEDEGEDGNNSSSENSEKKSSENGSNETNPAGQKNGSNNSSSCKTNLSSNKTPATTEKIPETAPAPPKGSTSSSSESD
jgi:hypothetical protein